MDLTTYMEAEGVSLKALAEGAGVTWRTARKAKAGRLVDARAARQIAASIGKRADGEFIVDPATMLALDPPPQGETEAA